MKDKAREPVRLRQKKLAGGGASLYLDTYVDGRRSYEFLRLYLVEEKSRTDKEKNRETLRLAAAVRAQRLVEVREGRYGLAPGRRTAVNFRDYFVAAADKAKSRQTRNSWLACLRQAERYDPSLPRLTFADITPKWVDGFRQYLMDKAVAEGPRGRKGAQPPRLTANSQSEYFRKLRACINRAYTEGVLADNPLRGIGNIKGEESARMYLTVEELRKLAATECSCRTVKDAFLFSCLTGLRYSDVERLRWGDIRREDRLDRLTFRQKKTGGQEYLDISPQASELLGGRGGDDDRPFADLPPRTTASKVLKRWVEDAGISKDITFHCGRHTFAVMMLDLGTDIYTVSKLLGHRDVATTQVYAKVLDKNKRAAVARIPDVLGGA